MIFLITLIMTSRNFCLSVRENVSQIIVAHRRRRVYVVLLSPGSRDMPARRRRVRTRSGGHRRRLIRKFCAALTMRCTHPHCSHRGHVILSITCVVSLRCRRREEVQLARRRSSLNIRMEFRLSFVNHRPNFPFSVIVERFLLLLVASLVFLLIWFLLPRVLRFLFRLLVIHLVIRLIFLVSCIRFLLFLRRLFFLRPQPRMQP